MQFHQGTRLKNLIEKSKFSVKEIAEKIGIPRSTVYDYFDKKEILPSKIQPFLDVLNITNERFYGYKVGIEDDTLPFENIEYKVIVELLQKQVEQNDIMIELLKKRK